MFVTHNATVANGRFIEDMRRQQESSILAVVMADAFSVLNKGRKPPLPGANMPVRQPNDQGQTGA